MLSVSGTPSRQTAERERRGSRGPAVPEFFASQYGRLRRLGFLLTGDWGEGDELAQETLVRVYWRWSLVRRQEHPEAYARKDGGR